MLKVIVLVISGMVLKLSKYCWAYIFAEVLRKRVLAVQTQRFSVKFLVGIEVICEILHEYPDILTSITTGLKHGCKFCVEDTVHQIIFILKVIVEAVSAQLALLTDVRNVDV